MMTFQLSGDEALARGAWEAGVRVATGYPGSPSTRFLEYLAEISRGGDLYGEWSANEKVALEVALGASMGGKRAAVGMKSVGLNVAMDPLMVANLGGVGGGLVIVLGDDPGAWGSQNEQDGRLLVRAAEVPLLEYASPQEAYDMALYAFSLSERFEVPVFIRETRAGANEKGPVHVRGERTQASVPPFPHGEPWKVLPLEPPEKHRKLHAKNRQIAEEFNRSPFNRMVLKSPRGILAAGYAAAKVSRLLQRKGAEDLSFLKLGTVWPPPEAILLRFLSGLESLLVAEELQPLLEERLRSLAQLNRLPVRIFGKNTGHLPRHGELFRKDLSEAVKECLGADLSPGEAEGTEGFPEAGWAARSLPPQCPHFRAFAAFSEALPEDPGKRPIFVGDDGCLLLLRNAPFSLLDSKFCMGASIGIAAGLARTGPQRPIVALVGDSSFFHTGLPAYLSAAASGARIKIIVLDNRCTAMTGCQSNPGSDFSLPGGEQRRISLEALLKSAGVPLLRQVEAFGDKGVLASAFREILESEGMAVLLVTGPCPNLDGKVC